MTCHFAILGGSPGVIKSMWVHAIRVAALFGRGVGLDEESERGISAELGKMREEAWKGGGGGNGPACV